MEDCMEIWTCQIMLKDICLPNGSPIQISGSGDTPEEAKQTAVKQAKQFRDYFATLAGE